MYIPEDVIQAKRKRYMRDGKPIHRTELLNDSEYDIINRYQGEYRGLVNYYALAQNYANLGYVGWTMETSLLKTLASKNQTSVMKESKRLKATAKTSEGPRKCLKVTIPREGKDATRSYIRRIVTQATQESRHQGSGLNPLCPHEIRASRKTTQRYMRSMWSQGKSANAPYPKAKRPEQKGQKGDAALDENHDSTKTQEHPAL